MMRRGRTAVLLGAGASSDAGLPLSDELTREVGRALADAGRPDRLGLVALFNQIVAAVIGHNGELGLSPESPLNIERIVSSIRLLAGRRAHEAAPFVRSWTPSLEDADRQQVSGTTAAAIQEGISQGLARGGFAASRLADRLTDAVHEATRSGSGEIFLRLDQAVVELVARRLANLTDVSYLQPLAELAREQGTLDIATLNYDLAVETFARERRIDLRRGIERRNADGSLSWVEVGINLYKVHGSIDWALSQTPTKSFWQSGPAVVADEAISVSDDPSRLPRSPAIVLGDREKLEALSVTVELMYEFNLALRRANRLIIVGYSFGDTHINRMIADWMDRDPSRRLSVLDPSWEEQPSQLSDSGFRGRLATAMAALDSAGLRGHVVKDGARDGLARVIDQWPDDPAARAIEVSMYRDGAAPRIVLRVETDDRVQGITFRATMPDAMNEMGTVQGEAVLTTVRVDPPPSVELPDLHDYEQHRRALDDHQKELNELLMHGRQVTVAIGPPQRPSPGASGIDVQNFDFEVRVRYLAGVGRRIWKVREGDLLEGSPSDKGPPPGGGSDTA